MRRYAPSIAVWIALLGLQSLPASSSAQQPPLALPRQASESPDQDSSEVRTSLRQVQRRFRQGRELAAGGNYTEGVQLLQSILDNEEDDFIPSEGDPSSPDRSLKFEAQALLGALPPAGREAYEKQFGPIARRLLTQGALDGDAETLGMVTRRFFHTQAGYEAAYRLATDHLDHGRSLTAALGFERLRQTPQADDQFEPMLSLKAALGWQRAGRDDKALEVLTALRHQYRQPTVVLGGRDVPLFDEPAQGLAWLSQLLGQRNLREEVTQQWTMPRGDVRRNAEGAGGGPCLTRSWRASTVEGSTVSPDKDAIVAQAIHDRRQAAVGDDAATVPAIASLQPLLVGDLVVVRGIGDLRAYDLHEGRLVWAAGEKDQLLADILRGGFGPQALVPAATPLALLVGQRLWSDATFGTISSDGDLVYAIEDLDLGYSRLPLQPSRMPLVRDYNRLAAYDVRTGMAVWEIGGPRGDATNELAGSFFLGPPLVLDRRLYVLSQSGSDIRLVVLAPESGRLVWSQSLADDPDMGREFHRRRSGLSPSYDGGILVCPTGFDQVTAVDLTARSLLWRYRGRHPTDAYDPRPPQVIAQQESQLLAQQSRGGFDQNRWLDSLAIVADGRVLLTPRDSNELHCLNLLDGTLAWTKPRGEALYVAGVHDGKVVLAGKSLVHALRLSDGTEAWQEPATIPLPSGRGYISGGACHVPLSTAEVATIELGSGRIVSRVRARRTPGNLIALRGHVVSQGADEIEVFRQLQSLEAEVARALADDPADASALVVRGEIHLQRGRVGEAYADLQRALQLQPGEASIRELLAGNLLEGLRVDFPRYRDLAVDLETLLATPAERSLYLWLRASGLQRSGEAEAAFAALLHFVESDVADTEHERVDGTLTVRRDRLVRSRVDQLYAAASPELRQRLDDAWRADAARVGAAGDPEAVRRLAAFFGRAPDSDRYRRDVIDSPSAGEWLAEEFALRGFDRSDDPVLAAAAAERLASLLLEAERPRDAWRTAARLEREWPEVVLTGGETGREAAARLRQSPTLQRELASRRDWPRGQVVSEREMNVGNLTGSRSYPLPVEGPRPPFFSETTVEISGRWQDFIARDDLGRPLWKLTLEGQIQPSNFRFNRAYPRDHLLLVAVGPQVMAIDSLGTAADPGPRVLWRMNLIDSPNQGMIVPRGIAFRPRAPFAQYGDQMGAVGPVTREAVAVLRGRKLLLLEPLTGKPLWVREGMTPGSELFGDEEFVCVVPPESNEAVVFKVLDGELVGPRLLPAAPDRLDLLGRHAVTWQQVGASRLLAVKDLPAGQTVWQREFDLDAKVALIEGREAAVLDGTGRFQVFSLEDGRIVFASDAGPSDPPQQILVLKSAAHYVLICHEPPTSGNGQVQITDQFSIPVNGRVHGFDRASGKRLWSMPVERQGLDPNQPSGLPILTFHCQLNRRVGALSENQFKLLCIDKRTGRVVYEDQQTTEPLHFVEFAVDHEASQIDLRMFRSTVRLTFTEKPWPDESR